MDDARIDEIDELLGSVCAAGYALGLIGEANIRCVESEFGDIVQRQRVYRLGDMAVLSNATVAGLRDGDKQVEARVAELVELLGEAHDYPVLDEQVFCEVQSEYEDEWVEEFARDNGVSAEMVWKGLQELDGCFEWEQDYVFLSNITDDELLLKARALGNSWSAHYGFGVESVHHYPDECWYCERAKEVA